MSKMYDNDSDSVNRELERRFVDTFTPWTLATTLEDFVTGAAETHTVTSREAMTRALYSTQNPHDPKSPTTLPVGIFPAFAPGRLIRPISAPAQRGARRKSLSPPSRSVLQQPDNASSDVDDDSARGNRPVSAVPMRQMRLDTDQATPSGRDFANRRRVVANPFKGFRAGLYAGYCSATACILQC